MDYFISVSALINQRCVLKIYLFVNHYIASNFDYLQKSVSYVKSLRTIARQYYEQTPARKRTGLLYTKKVLFNFFFLFGNYIRSACWRIMNGEAVCLFLLRCVFLYLIYANINMHELSDLRESCMEARVLETFLENLTLKFICYIKQLLINIGSFIQYMIVTFFFW